MAKVAILGASHKPDRYAYQALKMLEDYKHDVLLVNPGLEQIEGRPVVASLGQLPKDIDTLTVYVNPQVSEKMLPDIIQLKPRRVIFNPGSENPVVMEQLKKAGIEVDPACTLVLLRTGQF